jgi:hypothetical protein
MIKLNNITLKEDVKMTWKELPGNLEMENPALNNKLADGAGPGPVKYYANLLSPYFPGFVVPYEVLEGNPLSDETPNRIIIREMEVIRDRRFDKLVKIVSRPDWPSCKAVKLKNYYKSSFGIHTINDGPVAGD